jgi:hypothetical protein|tara:strand:+ start:4049 stop:4207 length:159 start_codon:yes stop_codon:yes gene_type:complete
MKKNILCEECEATYEIKHDLDSNYFIIEYCPFCGTQQDNENEYVSYEEDEDE